MLNTREEIETAIRGGGVVNVSSDSEITLTEPITVQNSVTILGGKFHTPAGTPAFEVRSSGVNFDGTEVRGSGAGGTRNSGEHLISCVGTSTGPLYDISIRNTKLYESSSDNIWLQYVNDAKVRGNTIHDFLYSGVLLLSCDGVDVSSNNIKDAPLSTGVVNTYGIAATDLTNTVAGRSKNITISSNLIENIEWEGIDTHGGSHIAITGNIVNNCVRGIALVVGNSTRVTSPTDCIVTGNLVDGMGSSREGISLFGLPGNPANATITGNTVKGHASLIYANQYDRNQTYIGGNSVPHIDWTAITLMNGWKANPTYTPQYMVDGDTVYLRGMVIPPAVDINPSFGNIGSAYAPDVLTFTGYTRGSSAVAGEAALGVSNAGVMSVFYHTIKDQYSYPITGQYRMV